jgi:putrescine transport system permease protein
MNILSAIRTRLVIIIPYIWLLFFFLLPFLLVLKIALSDLEYGQPPYTPQLSLSDGWSAFWDKISMFDLENFTFLINDSLYIKSYLSSLQIAGVDLFHAADRLPARLWHGARAGALRPTLLMLVILPFWTSFLIRVYAWIGILKQEGLLNQFLLVARRHRYAA